MAFCSYCGHELTPGGRFCAACGSPVEPLVSEAVVPVPETAAAPANTVPVYAPAEDRDYGLVLYSLGTCAKSYADDVLEDILGYTDSEAKQLVKMVPAQIAQSLTREQAQYIAQALTEYGMQVAVYKGENPVDLGSSATSSVFNSDGSFVTSVLAVLAGVSLANRITRPRRWTLTSILGHLFAPRYRVTAPPRHVSRMTVHRTPAPLWAPQPRRVTIPRQEPKRRFVSTPNRRSGGPGRGAQGGGHGGPGGRGR